MRIGGAISAALSRFDLSRCTHFFKADSGVKLPPDYLLELLSRGAPVAGRGLANFSQVPQGAVGG
ncbi:MAG: hypothetical protein QXU72_08585 [Thermofilum sp.]